MCGIQRASLPTGKSDLFGVHVVVYHTTTYVLYKLRLFILFIYLLLNSENYFLFCSSINT